MIVYGTTQICCDSHRQKCIAYKLSTRGTPYTSHPILLPNSVSEITSVVTITEKKVIPFKCEKGHLDINYRLTFHISNRSLGVIVPLKKPAMIR